MNIEELIFKINLIFGPALFIFIVEKIYINMLKKHNEEDNVAILFFNVIAIGCIISGFVTVIIWEFF